MMSDMVSARAAPGWLRIVAGLGLLWNLYGIYEYLKTVGVFPGADAASVATMPAWVTGAFAVAVFAGALGCLGLLMLKNWSRLMLLVSLLGVAAMDAWIFLLTDNGRAMAGPELGITVAVLVVAILLVGVSNSAGRKGWLS
jgi:hypothetical protein